MRHVFLFVLSLGLVQGSWAEAKPLVGKKAPAFSATDHTGKEQKLSAHKGKYVVLEFFNNECPYVDKHYSTGNMQKLQNELTKEGVVWFTVASSAKNRQGYVPDGKAAKSILKDRKAKSTTMLLDANAKIASLYRPMKTPHMFVIDPEGKVIYQGAIDDNRSHKKESVKGANNYVRMAISEHKANGKVTTADTQAYGCGLKNKI